jgi:hypothetical protein
MQIIRTVISDKKFNGEILIVETSVIQPSSDQGSVQQVKEYKNIVSSGDVKQINDYARQRGPRRRRHLYGAVISNIPPSHIAISQEGNITEFLYGDRSNSDYIEITRTKNFVSDPLNTVEIFIKYNFGMQKINASKIDDLSPIIRETLYTQSRRRNGRVHYHRELPFLINYALNGYSLQVLARIFVSNGLWGNSHDLWIVKSDDNSELSWKLVKVNMYGTKKDNIVKNYSCDITMEDLDDLLNSEEIEKIIPSHKFEIYGPESKNITISNDITFTTTMQPKNKTVPSKYNKLYKNDIYMWIKTVCTREIMTYLPPILQGYMSSRSHLSTNVVRIIVEYMISELTFTAPKMQSHG